MRRISHWWRLFGTGFCFTCFGVGGLVLGFVVFPAVHLVSRRKAIAHDRCRRCVHYGFRGFALLMETVGVIRFDISGREKLRLNEGAVVVANHPSLIDVIFIVSQIPDAVCIVKGAVWSNPFMAGIMWGAGYISNMEGASVLAQCRQAFADGKKLVVFPEGTRTVPSRPMRLRRGAAAIIAQMPVRVIPVTIVNEPTILTKGQPWYDIPGRRANIWIDVHCAQDLAAVVAAAPNASRAHRDINRALKETFERGIRARQQSRAGNQEDDRRST